MFSKLVGLAGLKGGIKSDFMGLRKMSEYSIRMHQDEFFWPPQRTKQEQAAFLLLRLVLNELKPLLRIGCNKRQKRENYHRPEM